MKEVVPGFGACKAGRCSCRNCPFTGAAAEIKTVVTSMTIQQTENVLPIKENITCRETQCLYILSWTNTGCMRQYAGLSSHPL